MENRPRYLSESNSRFQIRSHSSVGGHRKLCVKRRATAERGVQTPEHEAGQEEDELFAVYDCHHH